MENEKHKRIGEGEVTGHVHTVVADDAWVVGTEDERFLDAPTGTEVRHEEHKTLEIPPGQYRVYGQSEIDPETEDIQKVRD